jgi:hypothetical protein
VRLGDIIVGAPNAAPEGLTPRWLPGEPLQDSHIGAMLDKRIIADVARRLRGEQPLTSDPPQPLPNVKHSTQPEEPAAAAHASSDRTAMPPAHSPVASNLPPH